MDVPADEDDPFEEARERAEDVEAGDDD